MLAGVSTDDEASQTDDFANDDREKGWVVLHECAGEDRAECHCSDADKSKEADDEGRVVVGWGGEEEGEGCPVGSEGGGSEEAD